MLSFNFPEKLVPVSVHCHPEALPLIELIVKTIYLTSLQMVMVSCALRLKLIKVKKMEIKNLNRGIKRDDKDKLI